MKELLYPNFALRLLGPMLRIAVLGAVVAAVYGIAHDQITYTISPEYFTRIKFGQFHYADFGLPRRIFVAEIGVLATWWVGFIAGWFVARITVPSLPPALARRWSLGGLAMILGSAVAGSVLGYGLGLLRGPNADFGSWQDLAATLGIVDVRNFVRVAYIHNVGYLGALIGLVVALVYLRKAVQAACGGSKRGGSPQRSSKPDGKPDQPQRREGHREDDSPAGPSRP